MKKIPYLVMAALGCALATAPLPDGGVTYVTSAGAASPLPKFRLCTGLKDQNYNRAGYVLKAKARSSVDVEVLETDATLDNLRKMERGECDGAYVQADGLLVYSRENASAVANIERSGVLYGEYGHFLCNRGAGVDSVTDLKKGNSINLASTGSRVSWEAFRIANPAYKDVAQDTKDKNRSLASIADGSENQCMLWVGSLGATYMTSDAAALGKNIVLVDGYDKKLVESAKDPRGKPIYEYAEIPYDAYRDIIPTSWSGRQNVGTFKVKALLVLRSDYVSANSSAVNDLLRAFGNAGPDFAKIAAGK